jgi:perosamine synthetase
MHALDIGPGDEVIVSPMTFAASANCVLYQGGTPVFADVEPDTLLIDPAQVEAKVTSRTKAIVAVDYGGQPCDYDALRKVADRHGLALVADACHAVGGAYRGRQVGTLADLNCFSFHPVKHMTTGEGGMVTTDNAKLAQRMKIFRNHGIGTDHRERAEAGTYAYEMVELGYNYRITDFQCALGLSQLRKLPSNICRRQQLGAYYDRAFAAMPEISPLVVREGVSHAYHLYVIRLELNRISTDRDAIYGALRAEGIGVNVHYIPNHLHSYYRQRLGTGHGMCPVAETVYGGLLSLPLFSAMTLSDARDVVTAVEKVVDHYKL